ncbi:hypothetical protein O3M35_001021 [Rhynocoris fuscipes]|uniref:Uncharacterized protein n=1 Tax=Rhynocoris fuscipes TaxID=488301 RepID=A0AAW1DSR3_9HEMI
MEKKIKSQKEIIQEDKNLFQQKPPIDFHKFINPDGLFENEERYIQASTNYLHDRLPEDFITHELMFNLFDVESISSISTISDGEIEEVEQVHYDDEVSKKTLREIFYELVIEKYYNKIKPLCDDEDISECDKLKEGDQQTSAGSNEKLNNKEITFSIMDSASDESENEAIIINALNPTEYLLEEDINASEERLTDAVGCKSLETVLEDVSKSKQNGDYHINNIICLFKYNPSELLDDELPIDLEISDAIHNLNNNTIRPENNLYSLITGCIIVGDSTGILNLEISLFDFIRLISSLKWPLLKQNITEIRVLSMITDIIPIFETFTICRAFFNTNDNRHFPKILKLKMKKRPEKIKIKKAKLKKQVIKTKRTNDKDYYNKKRLRYLKYIAKQMGYSFKMKNKQLPSINKFKKKLKKENFKHSLEYLNEISEKLGYTFKLLKHQLKIHPCGVAELPPCASQHLPSRNLIMWALKCNYLIKWQDLVNDILQPKPYLDSTNNSYPAPTSLLINFHYLSVLDRDKTLTRIMYNKGFYPKFNENNQPELVLPAAFTPDIDDVFKNIKVQLINIDAKELNILSNMDVLRQSE